MRSFAAAVARLDAEVDNRLGDFLFYDVAGLRSSEPVRGTITDPADLQILGTDVGLDRVGQRRRLEISRLIVTKPTKLDRIRSNHPLLAGSIWKVSNWRETRGSRNWLIDLERIG